MRVAFLAAGAGGMYCGSCLRDNRVAAALISRGRDVRLIPLYTPLKLDEPDASDGRVFFGGVNVYLQQKSALFRHLPNVLNRWLDSPALMRLAGKRAGVTRAADLGELTVSMLRGEHGRQRRELDKLVAALRDVGPDLISLPNLLLIGLARRLREALGVPIVCTLSGEDIFTTQLPEPHRSEAYALIAEQVGDIDAFMAVTRYFADHAARHFGLPRERIQVVRMGIATEHVGPPASPRQPPFTIGYLARICPEKGLAHLVAAFLALRMAGRDVRLRVAGYLGAADRPYFDELVARVASAGEAERFEYCGELSLEQKYEFLRSLHAFSVPTEYHEAKGLFLLEALAAGVPAVQPRHGSFPELIDATGGGLLYDPDVPAELAAGLARLMDDPALRTACAERGRSAVFASFNTDIMADETWSVFEATVAARRPMAPVAPPPAAARRSPGG